MKKHWIPLITATLLAATIPTANASNLTNLFDEKNKEEQARQDSSNSQVVPATQKAIEWIEKAIEDKNYKILTSGSAGTTIEIEIPRTALNPHRNLRVADQIRIAKDIEIHYKKVLSKNATVKNEINSMGGGLFSTLTIFSPME